MAVGIIIGAAFGKIVSSLVADVIMPSVGVMAGGMNFTNMAITLKEGAGETPPVLLKYGVLVQATFDFVIVAGAVFLLVKVINRLKRQEEVKPAEPAAPPPPPKQEVLLEEIRDLLKTRTI
jgi:large conductance mechanosensitive channel